MDLVYGHLAGALQVASLSAAESFADHYERLETIISCNTWDEVRQALGPEEGSVVGYPGSKEISTEELLTTECDVLVPGALENQITAAIAEKLKCKIIGEAANGPTLPEADPILHKKGIFVIPDILANSGGVCISYLEWVQNNMGYYWSFDEVASKMETNIVKGLKDMYELSKKHKIDNRKAAMVLAVSRVLEAFNHKGIWP